MYERGFHEENPVAIRREACLRACFVGWVSHLRNPSCAGQSPPPNDGFRIAREEHRGVYARSFFRGLCRFKALEHDCPRLNRLFFFFFFFFFLGFPNRRV